MSAHQKAQVLSVKNRHDCISVILQSCFPRTSRVLSSKTKPASHILWLSTHLCRASRSRSGRHSKVCVRSGPIARTWQPRGASSGRGRRSVSQASHCQCLSSSFRVPVHCSVDQSSFSSLSVLAVTSPRVFHAPVFSVRLPVDQRSVDMCPPILAFPLCLKSCVPRLRYVE